MMLKLYDAMAQEKRDFVPITPGQVKMYVCGVTVYDHCHIGHARTFVVYDVLVNTLRRAGYDVNFVRNITDIDDKILKKAQTLSQDWTQVAKEYTQHMHEIMQALQCPLSTHEPRATDAMDAIIEMIEMLLEKGHAYRAGEDVLFSVESFASYGALSGQKLEHLMAGARVDVNPDKRSPLDFVLWKASKEGEPSWNAPFGSGRPGWHIECSAMIAQHLGAHIDIHGGGADLRFPHHENERAQSMCVHGGSFVNYWVYTGFVQVDDEKMSKSLGNFTTVADVLQHCHPEVLRLLLLQTHYRSPMSYSLEALEQSARTLERIYRYLEKMPTSSGHPDETFLPAFDAAMADDLNTPQAFAVFFEACKALMKEEASAQQAALACSIRIMLDVLGLGQQPAATAQSLYVGDSLDEAKIALLIQQRQDAKKLRDYAKADAIREHLTSLGVLLEDGPEGTRWRRQSQRFERDDPAS